MRRKPPAAPRPPMARNLFRRVSEGSHSGPVAAPGAKLTHMSLKADAYVMKRLPHHLTLTSMSYSTRGARLHAERRRRRMLRYGTHGGQRGREMWIDLGAGQSPLWC